MLGANPIPAQLKEAMVTSLSSESSIGDGSSAADIYRILNQSSLLSIGALKGARRSSFDLSSARLNPIAPLTQAIHSIANSRHLPWEAVAINYAILKGVLPLLQPSSREEMERCRQAVGWSLTINELTTLDRVSLPLAYKPKARSQQNLRMPSPLKRLLARPSKSKLSSQTGSEPESCASPLSPHRISIELPIQSMLASPPQNRRLSMMLEGSAGAGDSAGVWRADVTINFFPAEGNDGTTANPEQSRAGLLTPPNSPKPLTQPRFRGEPIVFPAPPQRPWSPLGFRDEPRPLSWSGQSHPVYPNQLIATTGSFATEDPPSRSSEPAGRFAYSQSQLLFDLELESSSPWNLSPKNLSMSSTPTKEAHPHI